MSIIIDNVIIKEDLISNLDSQLYSEELEKTNGMLPGRLKEFSAGRFLANDALKVLNIKDFPLLQGEDRTPVWPEGIAGSISHNHEYCMVAVCKKSDYKSVGVDIETITRLKSNLWSRICTSKEISQTREIMPSLRKQFIAIIFSAKESFYKCQYPVTHKFINFHDIEIEIDKTNSQFIINPVKIPDNFPPIEQFAGYYKLHSDCVKTLCLLRY